MCCSYIFEPLSLGHLHSSLFPFDLLLERLFELLCEGLFAKVGMDPGGCFTGHFCELLRVGKSLIDLVEEVVDAIGSKEDALLSPYKA